MLIYDFASGKRDGRFNCLNTADTISSIVFIFIYFLFHFLCPCSLQPFPSPSLTGPHSRRERASELPYHGSVTSLAPRHRTFPSSNCSPVQTLTRDEPRRFPDPLSICVCACYATLLFFLSSIPRLLGKFYGSHLFEGPCWGGGAAGRPGGRADGTFAFWDQDWIGRDGRGSVSRNPRRTAVVNWDGCGVRKVWSLRGLDIETIPTYHMSPRPVYRQFHKRENPEAIPFRTNAQN